MSRVHIAFVLFLGCLPAFAQPYNTGEQMISTAHVRSTYFSKDAGMSSGVSYDKFIAQADKDKPVVVHSHGCAGVGKEDEVTLKNFYTGIGMHFVLLDFIKRGDAGVCTHLREGNQNYKEQSGAYTADLRYRLPSRIMELVHHIRLLRENGFKTVYATGHSEGGMVVQLMAEKVDAIVIHSMTCTPTNRSNPQNRYLHLVSTRDPLLIKTPGRVFDCTSERPNYTVALSTVPSHGALADPHWAAKVREFLGVSETGR